MAIEKINNTIWTPPVDKERQKKNKNKESQKNDKKKKKQNKEGFDGIAGKVDIRV